MLQAFMHVVVVLESCLGKVLNMWIIRKAALRTILKSFKPLLALSVFCGEFHTALTYASIWDILKITTNLKEHIFC